MTGNSQRCCTLSGETPFSPPKKYSKEELYLYDQLKVQRLEIERLQDKIKVLRNQQYITFGCVGLYILQRAILKR